MKVARALGLSPLAVLDMAAAVVLWCAWHLNDHEAVSALVREEAAIAQAKLVNLAVWRPEALDDEAAKLSARRMTLLGITPPATDAETLALLFNADAPEPPPNG